jgi:hypothetical protein
VRSEDRGGLWVALEGGGGSLLPQLGPSFPFELDTFQKEAIIHLEQGHSVRGWGRGRGKGCGSGDNGRGSEGRRWSFISSRGTSCGSRLSDGPGEGLMSCEAIWGTPGVTS